MTESPQQHQPALTPPERDGAVPETPEQKRRKRRLIWLVVRIILVVALILLVLWLLAACFQAITQSASTGASASLPSFISSAAILAI